MLQHSTGGAVVHGEHGGFLESVVREAGVVDAVEVHAHPDGAHIQAGALVVEILAQGGIQDVETGRTHGVGVLAGADAHAAIVETVFLSGVVVQPPGAGNGQVEPGAAVHVVLDDALVNATVEQAEVHGVVVTGGLVVNGPVAGEELQDESSAGLVEELLLVGRVILARDEQTAIVEHVVGIAGFTCLHRAGQGQKGEEEVFKLHV